MAENAPCRRERIVLNHVVAVLRMAHKIGLPASRTGHAAVSTATITRVATCYCIQNLIVMKVMMAKIPMSATRKI